MKYKITLLFLVTMTGCTVISSNRVFPTVTWAWSKQAKAERQERRQEKAYKAGDTNWMKVP